MKRALFALTFGAFVFADQVSYAQRWPSGISGDIKFESSDFILKTANRNPGGAALDLNANGAYGDKNKEYDTAKKGPWFIDYQKAGADAVVVGIYKDDAAAIERGLKIINWGLVQQQQDGSFSSEDPYHNGLLFLESASRALLHLENSKHQSKFSREIKGAKVKIEKSIEWLMKPEIESPGLKKDEPYTHRYYINASAIGIAGVFLKRTEFIERSKKLVRLGVTRQNKDGSNPEKSGSDTSYHALGLLMAARYYSIVADEEMRKSLKTMGELGSQWLAGKVLENGDVDSAVNTRTGSKGEMRHGTELKTITYFSIYKALEYWGQILGRKDLNSKAELVFKFDRERKR
ncbi:MAG: hypothetical protein NDI61_06390 [Bdellovibrionaceae bacterium]|nr:hypothetical protein [Pseudobdellovibrionaceae bacterium]